MQLVGFDLDGSPGRRERKDNVNEIPKKRTKKRQSSVRPGSFESLGLNNALVSNLKHMGYGFPTPVQRKSIPPLLRGKDAVIMARTGSGKTAAFLLPTLNKLYLDGVTRGSAKLVSGIRCIVISPTRELAVQTYNFFKKYSKGLNLKACLLVGGEPFENQFAAIATNPDAIIATPGRLLQILDQITYLRLQSVESVILDEGDRLFEGNLGKDTRKLIELFFDSPSSGVSYTCQKILVSATLPEALVDFAQLNMHDPVFVRLDVEQIISQNTALAFFGVQEEEKFASLLYLIQEVLPKLPKSIASDDGNSCSYPKTIIFVASRHQVDFLEQLISSQNIPVTGIHGNKDSAARKLAVENLRSGRVRILLVTDLAARGLDIPFLDVVVHFDMPSNPKLFVHRTGRTGRAGRFGVILSLVTPDDLAYMLDLFLFLSREFQVASDQSRGIENIGDEQSLREASYIYGLLPNSQVSPLVDSVQNYVRQSVDLQYAVRAAQNGLEKYKRIRPCASSASIRRAKEILFNKPWIHPWLMRPLEYNTSRTVESVVQQLKSWRPQTAVVDPNFHKGNLRSHKEKQEENVWKEENAASSWLVPHEWNKSGCERKKMSRREMLLAKERSAYSNYLTKDIHNIFREKSLSVLSQEKGTSDVLHRSIVSVIQDDPEAAESQNRRLLWDRKRKKFVRPSNTPSKSSDKEEKNSVKSRFIRWMAKSRVRFQAIGEETDNDNIRLAQWNNRTMRKKGGSNSGEKLKQELKKPEQIRKERKKKALLQRKRIAKANKTKEARKEPRPSKQGRGARRRSFAIIKYPS